MPLPIAGADSLPEDNPPVTVPDIDPQCFRSVMGLWPTGVAVVTGLDEQGELFGLVIGSFISVSLEPPLVAFCPQKNSSSWQALRGSRRLCINFLSDKQADLCWRFASGAPHGRFEGLSIDRGLAEVPLLPECCAWIEVAVEHAVEAGDHWIVLCRVERMRQGYAEQPLAFMKGRLSTCNPLFQLADDHLGAWEYSLQQLYPS